MKAAYLQRNQKGLCAFCSKRLGADRAQMGMGYGGIRPLYYVDACPRCATGSRTLIRFVWAMMIAVMGAVVYMMFAQA